MRPSENDQVLTRDAFLGGQLQILQPSKGYRAGLDPVLLAASVPAKPGDSVLDLGCGVGVAGLCLAWRVGQISLTGLELQSMYAGLARQNATQNNISASILEGCVSDPPSDVSSVQFTHVMANPPYFDHAARTAAHDQGRETALAGPTPLKIWVATAAKRAAPKGTVTFINRVERLPELLGAFQHDLGSIEVLPLAPRPGRAAKLVLVRGRKGGNTEFRLHTPWHLHEGERHLKDGENYTTATACILRDAAALDFLA